MSFPFEGKKAKFVGGQIVLRDEKSSRNKSKALKKKTGHDKDKHTAHKLHRQRAEFEKNEDNSDAHHEGAKGNY